MSNYFSDPARLIDCSQCNGQDWPEEMVGGLCRACKEANDNNVRKTKFVNPDDYDC